MNTYHHIAANEHIIKLLSYNQMTSDLSSDLSQNNELIDPCQKKNQELSFFKGTAVRGRTQSQQEINS